MSAEPEAGTRAGSVDLITCIAWALPTRWRRAVRFQRMARPTTITLYRNLPVMQPSVSAADQREQVERVTVIEPAWPAWKTPAGRPVPSVNLRRRRSTR